MITVYAAWLNDGTAELDIKCEECGRWLAEPNRLTEITLSDLNHLADTHECPGAC